MPQLELCAIQYPQLHHHQNRRRPPPDRTPQSGGTGKKALSRCKRGPESALLVVKYRIGWRKGLIRLEMVTCKGPILMKTAGVKDYGNGLTVVVQEGDD